MPPNLRSVAAHVHRNSSWIRSRRNIPSDRRSRIVSNRTADGARNGYPNGPVGRVVWLITQGVSLCMGFHIGGKILGDVVSDLMDKEEKAKKAFAEDAEAHALSMRRKTSEVEALPWGSNSLVKK